jgi:PAS domain S-box-containing protein
MLHPEDRSAAIEKLESLVNGETDLYESEYRLRTRDNQWKWILSRGKVVTRDTRGRGLRILGAHVDITDRKKIEESLRQSEDRFRSFFDNAPVMLHSIGEDGLILDVNKKWLKETGYEKHEVIGRDATFLMTPESAQRAVQSVIPEFWKTGRVRNIPYQYVRKNREVIDVVLSCDAITDEDGSVRSLSVVQNVTEQKKTQEALASSEKKLRAIFDSAAIGIALKDKEGRYVRVNNAFSEMMGYGPKELISMAPMELIDEKNRPDTGRLMNDLLNGRVEQVCKENKFINKDGPGFYGRQIVSALRGSDGSLEGLIEIVENITERKKAQETAIYKERLNAFSELAGGVTHNFNNLLQMVMSGAQLAAEHLAQGRSKAAEYKLIKLVESCRFGANTVRRLQDLVGLQSDRNEKVFDLAEIAGQAAEMSKSWRQKPDRPGAPPIDLVLDLQRNCFVKGCNHEIFEVVVNIIKNAAEATPPGGEITISTRKEGRDVKLIVQDNGVGIPKEYIDRIFDSFWSSKGMNGTGMGLSVSMAMVKRHKGDISVSSEEGKGATFIITLPASAPEISENREYPERSSVVLPLNILVIDDMVPLLDMMGDALSECGHKVHMANSGAQGLELLANEEIDAIICDMAMPGFSGLEVAREARALCRSMNKTPPAFVLMTGGDYSESDETLQKYFINAVMRKPVDIYQVLNILEKHAPNCN